MSAPKPSDAQLRSMLTMNHFGSDPGPLAPSDPLTAQGMKLSVDRIDFYDRNPRHMRNAHYEEIKESIRSQGMQQPLVVTRRPGSERFMLRFGGNTRLSILRELFAETGDQRFQIVSCLFEPWTNETDVLVGHLIENETRGELSFIDKARAVRDAKLLIEAESHEPVSKRQLAELLKGRGYRIQQPQISWYDYALDVLAEAIPTALESGIGNPQVRRLRQLDGAANIVWHRRQLGSLEIYRAVFGVALSSADGGDWDFERARRAVETALANRANVDTRLIVLELGTELDDSLQHDDDDGIPAYSGTIEATPATEPVFADTSFFGSASDPPVKPLSLPTWSPADVAAPAPRTATATKVNGSPTPERSAPLSEAIAFSTHAVTPGVVMERVDAVAEPSPELDLSDPDSVRDHLHALLDQLRTAGMNYAHLSGLDQCTRSTGSPWIRLGYIVTDFPDTKRCVEARQDEHRRQVLAWSWWTLALCCDLCGVNEQLVRQHPDPAEADAMRAEIYGPQSSFVTAWRDLPSVMAAIRQTVGHADPFGYADYVEAVSTELWSADITLRQAYRAVRSFAASAGLDLLGEPLRDAEP